MSEKTFPGLRPRKIFSGFLARLGFLCTVHILVGFHFSVWLGLVQCVLRVCRALLGLGLLLGRASFFLLGDLRRSRFGQGIPILWGLGLFFRCIGLRRAWYY